MAGDFLAFDLERNRRRPAALIGLDGEHPGPVEIDLCLRVHGGSDEGHGEHQRRVADHPDSHAHPPRPPWGHPRYPARDGGAERLVLSPKRLLERGVFVRHGEDVEEEPEQRAVDDEAPIAHQHRLTQDDGNDRDVYWITHITVETGHHEIPGRRDGRGGAETLQRETRKCVNDPRHACENHYRAEAARQLQTKERRLELPTRDRPWNEPRHRAWGDHEENRRAQDGNGSLHGGSRKTRSLRAHSTPPFIRTTNQSHTETFTLVCVEDRRGITLSNGFCQPDRPANRQPRIATNASKPANNDATGC